MDDKGWMEECRALYRMVGRKHAEAKPPFAGGYADILHELMTNLVEQRCGPQEAYECALMRAKILTNYEYLYRDKVDAETQKKIDILYVDN